MEAVTSNLWSVDDKFEYILMTIVLVIDIRQHSDYIIQTTSCQIQLAS